MFVIDFVKRNKDAFRTNDDAEAAAREQWHRLADQEKAAWQKKSITAMRRHAEAVRKF